MPAKPTRSRIPILHSLKEAIDAIAESLWLDGFTASLFTIRHAGADGAGAGVLAVLAGGCLADVPVLLIIERTPCGSNLTA